MRDGAAAIPLLLCDDSDTQTCPQARTHARMRTRPHLHALTCVRLGLQDFEPHPLQFQSGLKRLEKIGEEGAS